jgi:hypothetical protein
MKLILLAIAVLFSNTSYADEIIKVRGRDVLTVGHEREAGQKLPHMKGEVVAWTDVYSGPQGDGVIEHEEKEVEGKTFRRSKHTGPEQRQDTKWRWVEVKEVAGV